MADETEAGSPGASASGRHPRGGREFSSPLQARAAFFKNWNWESIVGINRGACERGGAQHGLNSETAVACAQAWEALRSQNLTLAGTLDQLREFHRKAPFLFFNGNTFATIGRELAFALFGDLVATRRREAASAVAHYIAGVLDRQAMSDIVEGLCESALFKPGDRVQTFRGSSRGVVLRLLDDGRVVWRPDGSSSELIGLPESLLRTTK